MFACCFSVTPLDDDVALPLGGRLEFGARAQASGDDREITVGILPCVTSQESEEVFIVELFNFEPAELDPRHQNVTITVRKKVRAGRGRREEDERGRRGGRRFGGGRMRGGGRRGLG